MDYSLLLAIEQNFDNKSIISKFLRFLTFFLQNHVMHIFLNVRDSSIILQSSTTYKLLILKNK